MATDLDLVNYALGLVGQDELVSLDDTTNSRVVRLANRFLPLVKKYVLRARDWNCARARQILATVDNPDTDPNRREWRFAYALPSDYLCMRRFSGWQGPMSFSVEGKTLLTDVQNAAIVYTKNLDDVNQWASVMIVAGASKLAAELSGPLVRDFKMQEAFLKKWAIEFDEAVCVDEGEGFVEQFRGDGFIDVRNRGRSVIILPEGSNATGGALLS